MSQPFDPASRQSSAPPQLGRGSDAMTVMRYDAHKKSTGVAYLLWFVLGVVSGHRFYLGRTGSALGLTALFFVSLLMANVGGPVGVVPLFIWVIWSLVDAVPIAGITRRFNE